MWTCLFYTLQYTKFQFTVPSISFSSIDYKTYREDSDQHAHVPSQIKFFNLRKDVLFLHAQSKDSGQTGLMQVMPSMLGTYHLYWLDLAKRLLEIPSQGRCRTWSWDWKQTHQQWQPYFQSNFLKVPDCWGVSTGI